jgi:hypothetical protein
MISPPAQQKRENENTNKTMADLGGLNENL